MHLLLLHVILFILKYINRALGDFILTSYVGVRLKESSTVEQSQANLRKAEIRIPPIISQPRLSKLSLPSLAYILFTLQYHIIDPVLPPLTLQMSGRGGRAPSGPWGRLKPVTVDPLECYGLPSKGDNRYIYNLFCPVPPNTP